MKLEQSSEEDLVLSDRLTRQCVPILFVVSSEFVTASATALCNLASAMGLQSRNIIVSGKSELNVVLNALLPNERCAIALSSTFFGASEVDLPDRVSHCLIYGFAAGNGRDSNVYKAAAITLQTAKILPTLYRFCEGQAALLGPFAGLCFPNKKARSVTAFIDVSGGTVLIEADGRAIFVVQSNADRKYYFWAIDGITDAKTVLLDQSGIRDVYLDVVPALAFLRNSFGEACWHASAPTARLIVDDPLVRRSYGFLTYSELMHSMRRKNYGATVAFIPWNFRRSDPSTARSLAEEGQRFSLCVHGCDHTNHEFALISEGAAVNKCLTAFERMREHEARCGLSFDRVMVFPQGQFSASSVSGLQSCGMLAAVNSTAIPYEDHSLRYTIDELMAPAITRFGGFPLFLRRYPTDIVDFAFDIFLGKPALIVEHHAFARGGFEAFETFVEKLNAIEPELHWLPLEELVKCCCRERAVDSIREVIFYTREFTWTNRCAETQRVRFKKFEPSETVDRLTLNGREMSFDLDSGWIVVESDIASKHVVELLVVCREKCYPPHEHVDVCYRVNVLVRRFLSELRDNVLSRSPIIMKCATWLVNVVKASG